MARHNLFFAKALGHEEQPLGNVPWWAAVLEVICLAVGCAGVYMQDLLGQCKDMVLQLYSHQEASISTLNQHLTGWADQHNTAASASSVYIRPQWFWQDGQSIMGVSKGDTLELVAVTSEAFPNMVLYILPKRGERGPWAFTVPSNVHAQKPLLKLFKLLGSSTGSGWGEQEGALKQVLLFTMMPSGDDGPATYFEQMLMGEYAVEQALQALLETNPALLDPVKSLLLCRTFKDPMDLTKLDFKGLFPAHPADFKLCTMLFLGAHVGNGHELLDVRRWAGEDMVPPRDAGGMPVKWPGEDKQEGKARGKAKKKTWLKKLQAAQPVTGITLVDMGVWAPSACNWQLVCCSESSSQLADALSAPVEGSMREIDKFEELMQGRMNYSALKEQYEVFHFTKSGLNWVEAGIFSEKPLEGQSGSAPIAGRKHSRSQSSSDGRPPAELQWWEVRLPSDAAATIAAALVTAQRFSSPVLRWRAAAELYQYLDQILAVADCQELLLAMLDLLECCGFVSLACVEKQQQTWQCTAQALHYVFAIRDSELAAKLQMLLEMKQVSNVEHTRKEKEAAFEAVISACKLEAGQRIAAFNEVDGSSPGFKADVHNSSGRILMKAAVPLCPLVLPRDQGHYMLDDPLHPRLLPKKHLAESLWGPLVQLSCILSLLLSMHNWEDVLRLHLTAEQADQLKKFIMHHLYVSPAEAQSLQAGFAKLGKQAR